MKLRTIIVDDEPLARDRIRSLLAQEADVEVVAECADGAEAISTIREQRPDLVFLDIQMPVVDGMGVVRSIGAREMPMTVFVTAFDRYALQAFEAHAVDYLLKPFDQRRFRETLERIRRLAARDGAGVVERKLDQLLQALVPAASFLERFVVRTGARIVIVPAQEVDWIAAEGNYVRLHVAKRSYLVRDTMAGLEEKLDPTRFVRIHRSTIVKVAAIAELESVFQGEYLVILRDGTRLTSSRAYRQRLEQAVSICDA
jgi:two-component system, LytTR family, response regulator